VALVSAAAGLPVAPQHHFLCPGAALGVCPVHRAAPESKWTLDGCLDQSECWPIHCSTGQAWSQAPDEPESNPWDRDDWEDHITHSGEFAFTPALMPPGEAMLFSQSSPWHCREAIPASPARSDCALVCFQSIPVGTSERVRPDHWARRFDAPGLQALDFGHSASVRVNQRN
jgi:hypothetical protein